MKKIQFNEKNNLTQLSLKKLREFGKELYNKEFKNKIQLIKYQSLEEWVEEYNFNVDYLNNLKKQEELEKSLIPIDMGFNKSYQHFHKNIDKELNQTKDVLPQIKPIILRTTKDFLEGLSKKIINKKVYITISFELETNEKDILVRSFSSIAKPLLNSSEFIPYIKEAIDYIINEHIVKLGNSYEGISIVSITELDIHLSTFNPFDNGKKYEELPKDIKDKKAIVNIQNKDNLCFFYSILSCLLEDEIKEKRERVSHYINHLNKLKITPKLQEEVSKDGLNPNSQSILHFEKSNNLSIYIYSCNVKKEISDIIPIRISNTKQKPIYLFYYKGHYSWIKNFNRLVNRGSGGHNCPRCLKYFRHKEKLEEHKENCEDLKCIQKTIMPNPKKEEDIMKFKDGSKQNRLPIVIYGDFEAINQKQDVKEGKSLKKLTEHKVASYRFYIKSDIDLGDIPLDYDYIGEDANSHFVKTICDLEKQLQYKIIDARVKYQEKMIITEEQKKEFKLSKKCYMCGGAFTKEDIKVKDHNHFTGCYRGSAHQSCNLACKLPKRINIPVVFHNLNYDLRLIINSFNELGKVDLEKMNMSVIADNQEKYKCFSLNSFRFIDSFAFLSTSLEKLISNVPNDKKQTLRRITTDNEKFNYINKKGEFPYLWFDDINKIIDDIQIPKREEFYNDLSRQELKETQYEEMMTTCEKFNIRNFKEFHNLYLKRDVYSLCDVFEYFRDISLRDYGLDPTWFMGSPSFAWNAMLKMTGVQIELLKNEDQYIFFEKGIRGGISKAVLRYAKANNKYLKNYDKSKPTSFLNYKDANNLYGLAMSQFLPTKGFSWLSDEEIEGFDLNKIPNLFDDNDKREEREGCTLEVDLEIPEELHQKFNDYPLFPRHKKVKEAEISDYARNSLLNRKTKFSSNPKLVCSLEPVEKYVIHSSTLKLYTDLGAKLTKIHRGMKYTETRFLKNYIDFNTKKRAEKGRTDFEKDFYKLLNNAVFGKTMEGVRNRQSYRFVSQEDKFIKLASKPEFERVLRGIGNENFRIVKMITPKVKLDKPIFIGQAVLDISKNRMYDFYYNDLKKTYGDKVNLVMTDTDSFIVKIETEDIYKDMLLNSKEYDTSAYPENHFLHSNENKKVVGKFKDELCDNSFGVMSEVCAIQSKVYAFKYEIDGIEKEKKTLKGVNRVVKDKDLTFQDYKDCLFENKIVYKEQTSIRSFNCVNYTIKQNKRCLSNYDDKRYILQDGINSLAYGHKDIKKV